MARNTKAKSKRSARGSSRKSSKKKSINIDLSEVETRKVLSEGDYLLTLDAVEQREGDTADYLSMKFKIGGGGVAYDNVSLSPSALWKLRQYLEAFGYDIPDSAFDLDPDDLVGMTCGGLIDVDTYEGTRKNIIVDVFPEEDIDEDSRGDDEEDEDPPKKSRGKSKKEEDDEEDEDEDEDEDDEGEEEPPKRKSRSKKSGAVKKGSKVSFQDDGEDYEGKVVKISKDGVCDVEVDEEIWELERDDLTVI